MKLFNISITLTVLIVFTILSGCDTKEQKSEDLARFNKLGWMAAIWHGEQDNAKIYESWHKKNFRLMEGISYTTDKNGQRVYSQNMRIEQNNNQIFYIIRLPGDQQRTLKLTSVTDSSAVFDNQDRGYPSKIIYRHPKPDSMIVSLEGKDEGNAMSTILDYQKD